MTRRTALAMGAIAGNQMLLAKAAQPKTPLSFEPPRNSCDCHTHLFGDPKHFPLIATRGYTPEITTPDEMAALHRALRVERVVIVTPSVYGTDNSATLFGMKARGKSARGIAVIDGKTTDKDLAAMDKAGIRGVRINLGNAAASDIDAIRARVEETLNRINSLGWHLQLFAGCTVIAALKDVIASAPLPVVLDHFGGAKLALGPEQPGFAAVLELVSAGKVYVKLSLSATTLDVRPTPKYELAAPLAKALIAANQDRMLWATDWPHPEAKGPGESPFNPIDDGLVLNQLAVWAPDAALRRKILADNPARVYEF